MPLDLAAAVQSPWLTWRSLTWFGDSALLLPAGAAVGFALLFTRGWFMLAFRWALAFGGVGFVVLATKVAFVGWGIGSAAADFTGISGHTALASVFWPAACWMATDSRSRSVRRVCIVFGALLAAAVGYSRLVLDAHSASEVASGLTLGYLASAWFITGASRVIRSAISLAPVALLVTAALVVLLHGRPAPTTPLIERVVVRILGISQPFTRHDLHRRYRS